MRGRIENLCDARDGEFVILDDIDRPCAKNVAQVINGSAHYLREGRKRSGLLGDGMSIKNATCVKKFGFTIKRIGADIFFIRDKDKSTQATYEDGKLRRWQDNSYRFTYKSIL